MLLNVDEHLGGFGGRHHGVNGTGRDWFTCDDARAHHTMSDGSRSRTYRGLNIMDPVTLGLAASALLASKFGEGLAKDAGSSTWRAITGLREVIAKKFGHGPETPTALVALEPGASSEEQAAAAEVIDDAVRTDPGFAAAVRQLVDTAREDKTVEVIVANAYDQAKQLNIHGGNTGTITFT